ncbi:MAG TPA: glycosyltransferase family 2 protein [Geminicoccaceae bacterium]|nr:glycosyltransferase family 2 protein [Geminicoccus sp.]HMU50780.1 glycosyltransferase family 2 protein [Geminicoccaceae bacterium]
MPPSPVAPPSPGAAPSPAGRGVALSIIIPLYNEEDNVRLMYEAVRAAVAPIGLPTELIFVDDGSRDATFARALELPRHADGLHLRLVKLRKNAGQTAAMVAGIDHARGDVLITMDGDLQNDPADIPLFLDKIAEGYDLVVGWRHKRQDHFSRVLPSKVANWLIARVTGVPIRDNGCSLKAYRADLIKRIPLYSEMHRFIPAMASLAAPRLAQIKVRHHPRKFGASKYGFSRIYKVALDLVSIRTILSFSRNPMAWLGSLAGLSALASLLALALSLIYGTASTGRASIVFAGLCVLLGAFAIFMTSLGILNHLIYAAKAGRLRAFLAMAAKPVGDAP